MSLHFENTRRHLGVVVLFLALVATGCGEDKIKKGEQTVDPGTDIDTDEDSNETRTEDDADVSPPPSDTTEDGGGSGTDVVGTMQEFTTNTQNTYCQKIFECCTASERANRLGITAESESECKEDQRQVAFAGAFSDYTEALEEGTVEYDPAAAERCKSGLEDKSCGEFSLSRGILSSDRVGCSQVFKPQLTVGDSCDEDLECKTGFCKRTRNEDGGYSDEDRECAEAPEEGDPCPSGRCGEGAYCDTSTGGLPEDWVCKEESVVGQSCLDNSDCVSGSCQQVEDGGRECVKATNQDICSG